MLRRRHRLQALAAAALLAGCDPGPGGALPQAEAAPAGRHTGRAAPRAGPVVLGVVRDAAGAPVPGADVLVGSRRVPDPEEVDACEIPLTALARTVSGRDERFRLEVPRDSASAPPNCVLVFAELPGDTLRSDGPAARSEPGSYAVAGDTTRVELALVPVPGEPEADRSMRTPDDAGAELARTRVPGFAGVYFEGCTLVVNLTDPARQHAAARAYAESEVTGRPDSGRLGCAGGGRAVRFRQVEYDYAQLVRWYGRAQALTALPGWSASDVDETDNRLVFEFSDPRSIRRAERTLATLRVPRGAVMLRASDRAPTARDTARFGPAEPRLGRRLARRFFVPRPAWSADGREIFFVAPGGMGDTEIGVRAVDVRSGRLRELGSVRGTNSGRHHLQPSADGRTLYFAATGASGSRDEVYRIPTAGGPAKRVAGGLAWPLFAVSPDGRRAALVHAPGAAPPHGGRLAVAELPGGAPRHVAGPADGFGEPLEFSPDGRTLLYTLDPGGHPARAGVWTVALPGGTPRRAWALPPVQDRMAALGGVRWANGSARLLIVERGGGAGRLDLTVLDAARGTRTRFGRVAAGRLPTAAAWSGDGQRAALWVPVAVGPQSCSPAGVCISRDVVHWKLFVVETGGGEPRVAAEVAADEGATWLAFSPDGRQLGYSLQGRLHVQPLEPPARP